MTLTSLRVSRQAVALAALWIVVLAAAALAFRPGGEVGLTAAEYIARDAGVVGSDRVIATVDMPGTSRWGMMAYRSKGGMLCTVAGPMRRGVVGRMTPVGYQPFRLYQSPGSCGDVAANIQDLGGIALTEAGPVAPRSRKLAAVIYGLTGPDAVSASVRMPDGTTNALALSHVDGIPGVGSAFLSPLRAGGSPEGMVVRIAKRDGSTSDIRF